MLMDINLMTGRMNAKPLLSNDRLYSAATLEPNIMAYNYDGGFIIKAIR